MRYLAALALSTLVLLGPGIESAEAVVIDSCGSTISKGQVGVMTTDLVCDADLGQQVDGSAILIENKGTLDMNGHDLTVLGAAQGIRCAGKCVVTSNAEAPGGIIRGDVGGFGGVDGASTVTASHLAIEGNWSDGVRSIKQVRASDVSCTGTQACLESRKVRATQVIAINGKSGILARRSLRAEDVVVSDNSHWAIDAGNKMRGENVTVTNNGMMGIDASAGAPGNGGPIKLSNSVVTGNPIDLYTPRPPKLRDTVCDTSRNSATGFTWGVCSAD